MSGLGTILGAVNFVTTIVCLRAPGHDDVPDADLHLEHPGHEHPDPAGVPDPHRRAARRCRPTGTSARTSIDPANGGAILWQHLFWFFGHPEVYIVALPFFGIVTEIFPVFSRKPMFGYKRLVYATIAIGALSIAVWAHHMYATGAVLLPFFAFTDVPHRRADRHQVLQLDRHDVARPADVRDADAVLGRLPGDVPASAASPASCWPARRWTSTSPTRYFVVAHFHYVLFGTIVFATYAGIYFWFPKMTGRMMDERLGKLHFWLTFIGFHMTFLVQHWLGNEGMPRRYADYLATDGFTTLNTISTIGAFILGASTLPFLWNVFHSYRYGRPVRGRRPLGPRQLAGVGDVVPAAAAQLHRAAPHPLRAPGVRAALPAHGRPAPARGPRRLTPTLARRARRRRHRAGAPARHRPPQPVGPDLPATPSAAMPDGLGRGGELSRWCPCSGR